MSVTGTSIVDFGAWPGLNETTVAVTGQGAILSTSTAEAWFMAEATSDHTANDHAYIGNFVNLSCTIPTNGVGFTINAFSPTGMNGTFQVRWVWA